MRRELSVPVCNVQKYLQLGKIDKPACAVQGNESCLYKSPRSARVSFNWHPTSLRGFLFLLENFIWLSFLENPALPILQGQSELSRCCYFRELILAWGSIVLPSALPPCSHTHGPGGCMGRRVAGTSGLYRLTRKPCLGTWLSRFMLLSIPQGHLCMVKNKNSPAGKNMEKASTEWL